MEFLGTIVAAVTMVIITSLAVYILITIAWEDWRNNKKGEALMNFVMALLITFGVAVGLYEGLQKRLCDANQCSITRPISP